MSFIKSKIFIIVILVAMIGIGLFINFGDRKTYEYAVSDEIKKLSLIKGEVKKQVTDEEINNVIKIFDDKTTDIASIQDYPTNAKELIKVNLNKETIYVYRRGFRYYFEIPYNGIYRITKKEYRYLNNLISES